METMSTVKRKLMRNQDSNLGPPLWMVFMGDTHSIVVKHDTTPAEAVAAFIEEYCGETISVDHPFVIKEARTVEISRWFSCSKDFKESECVDDPDLDWWTPDGDGARWCYVALFERSAYTMLELMEETK
jgi:hypothetical protein